MEQDPQDFYSQFASTVMHNAYMFKAFAPAMLERGAGKFIVINTECAMRCDPGAADINEELGGDRRVDLAHAAVQQNGGQAAERSLVKLQQRLFACPRMFKVRQKRRKLAVSGAENADFSIHGFRLRCDFYPLYLRPPALSTALRAKNQPSGKTSIHHVFPVIGG